MQSQASASPHRTDIKRGNRVRVESGIFTRAGKWIVVFNDHEGDHCKTLAWIKSDEHPDGLTLRDVRAARERLRVKARDGEVVAPQRIKFGEVAEEYLSMFESLVAAGEKSERTLELYRQRYRSHLEKALGGRRVQDIQPRHLADLLGDLRRAGLSSWTVRGILTLAGSILNHAVTRGYRADNPVTRLSRSERPQAKNRTKARILSVDDIGKLIANTLPSYRPLIVSAVYTAMRQSELLGLRWSDIDFEGMKIHVRHQLTRARPAKLVALKSDAGERDLDLAPELAKVLREHKLASAYSKDADFVFATLTGQPIYYRNASARGLEKAADRGGLNRESEQRVSFHDLRHTAITHLIRSGADVAQVQRFAGHAKPSITLDIYVGEFEAQKGNDVGTRLSAAFTGVLG